jgi:SAM-dependent methyltransferase
MFGWFRRGSRRPATSVAMVGPRASDAVLFLGAGDPALAAGTGAVTRLNGQTVVVLQGADLARRVSEAAEREGALLDTIDAPLESLPLDRDSFNIVVAPDIASWPASARTGRLAEATRVLKPGGRLIATTGDGRRGRPSPVQGFDPIAELTALGLVAARKLAETDGVTYYEARRPR